MVIQTNRHHNSERLAGYFTKEYFKSGINITFTTEPDDLNEENLVKYDGFIVYANHDTISDSQEKALLDFVQKRKRIYSAALCLMLFPQFMPK